MLNVYLMQEFNAELGRCALRLAL